MVTTVTAFCIAPTVGLCLNSNLIQIWKNIVNFCFRNFIMNIFALSRHGAFMAILFLINIGSVFSSPLLYEKIIPKTTEILMGDNSDNSFLLFQNNCYNVNSQPPNNFNIGCNNIFNGYMHSTFLAENMMWARPNLFEVYKEKLAANNESTRSLPFIGDSKTWAGTSLLATSEEKLAAKYETNRSLSFTVDSKTWAGTSLLDTSEEKLPVKKLPSKTKCPTVDDGHRTRFLQELGDFFRRNSSLFVKMDSFYTVKPQDMTKNLDDKNLFRSTLFELATQSSISWPNTHGETQSHRSSHAADWNFSGNFLADGHCSSVGFQGNFSTPGNNRNLDTWTLLRNDFHLNGALLLVGVLWLLMFVALCTLDFKHKPQAIHTQPARRKKSIRKKTRKVFSNNRDLLHSDNDTHFIIHPSVPLYNYFMPLRTDGDLEKAMDLLEIHNIPGKKQIRRASARRHALASRASAYRKMIRRGDSCCKCRSLWVTLPLFLWLVLLRSGRSLFSTLSEFKQSIHVVGAALWRSMRNSLGRKKYSCHARRSQQRQRSNRSGATRVRHITKLKQQQFPDPKNVATQSKEQTKSTNTSKYSLIFASNFGDDLGDCHVQRANAELLNTRKPTEDPHTLGTPTTPKENEIVFHAPTPSLSGQHDYEGVSIQSAAELEAYYITHAKESQEDMCANSDDLLTEQGLSFHSSIRPDATDIRLNELLQEPKEDVNSPLLATPEPVNMVFSQMSTQQLKDLHNGKRQDKRRCRPNKETRALIKAELKRREPTSPQATVKAPKHRKVHLDDLSDDDFMDSALVEAGDFGDNPPPQAGLLDLERVTGAEVHEIRVTPRRPTQDELRAKWKAIQDNPSDTLERHTEEHPSPAANDGCAKRSGRSNSSPGYELIYGCGMNGGEDEAMAAGAGAAPAGGEDATMAAGAAAAAAEAASLAAALRARWQERTSRANHQELERHELEMHDQAGDAPRVAPKERLTPVRLERFRDNLRAWSDRGGGKTEQVQVKVKEEDHEMIHVALMDYHTKNLSNATSLKRITPESVPIPLGGLVFLQLVAVPGHTLDDALYERSRKIAASLVDAGLRIAQANTPLAHSFKYYGRLERPWPLTVSVKLEVSTPDERTNFYNVINGLHKIEIEDSGNVIPLDAIWMTRDESTPRVKLRSPTMAVWMSFHHRVAGLSPRACVSAFLKWLISKVRGFERLAHFRATIELDAAGPENSIFDRILGIEVLTSPFTDITRTTRERVHFDNPRAQWRVVLSSDLAAARFDKALNAFKFALPLAGAELQQLIDHTNAPRRLSFAEDHFRYLWSAGVYELNLAVARVPRPPPVRKYILTLTMNSRHLSMTELVQAQSDGALLTQARLDILVIIKNVFALKTELSLLTSMLDFIDADTCTQNSYNTAGRWLSFSFICAAASRTFLNGLHYLMQNLMSDADFLAAVHQVAAKRGLPWSPMVTFWGARGCRWLYDRRNDLTITYESELSGRRSPLQPSVPNVPMMRDYTIDEAYVPEPADWQQVPGRQQRPALENGPVAGTEEGGVAEDEEGEDSYASATADEESGSDEDMGTTAGENKDDSEQEEGEVREEGGGGDQ